MQVFLQTKPDSHLWPWTIHRSHWGLIYACAERLLHLKIRGLPISPTCLLKVTLCPFNPEKALVEHQTSRRLDSSCSLHVVCSQWSSSPNICSDIIITAIARHLIHRKCCCLAAINLHFVMHFVFGVLSFYFHTLPPYPLCKFYASQLSVIQILILWLVNVLNELLI